MDKSKPQKPSGTSSKNSIHRKENGEEDDEEGFIKVPKEQLKENSIPISTKEAVELKNLRTLRKLRKTCRGKKNLVLAEESLSTKNNKENNNDNVEELTLISNQLNTVGKYQTEEDINIRSDVKTDDKPLRTTIDIENPNIPNRILNSTLEPLRNEANVIDNSNSAIPLPLKDSIEVGLNETVEITEEELESIWESPESNGLLESETVSSEKFQTEEVSDPSGGWYQNSTPSNPDTFTTASFTGPEDIDWTSSALDSTDTTNSSRIHTSAEIGARPQSSMDMETTYEDDSPDTEEYDSPLHSEFERLKEVSTDSSEGLSKFGNILSESDVNDSSSMMENVGRSESSRSDFPGTLSTKDSYGASDSEDICSESPDSRSSEDDPNTSNSSDSSESDSSTSRCTSSGTSSCLNGSDKSLYNAIHIHNFRGCSVMDIPGNLLPKDGRLPGPGEVKYVIHDERSKMEKLNREIFNLGPIFPLDTKLNDTFIKGKHFQFISAFDEPDRCDQTCDFVESFLPLRFLHTYDTTNTLRSQSKRFSTSGFPV